MALLTSLFDNMGQLAPQESPTDELMRRALELNKNAAQPQGIMVSRPDMPDVVNRILGPQQAPASAPQPQAVSRPIALPPLNQAAASAVPQREPSFMDRMAAFASGYQGGGLIGAIANASQGPDKAVQLENQTAQLLAGRLGVTPTEALALAKRPDIMQQLLPVLTNKGRATEMFNGKLIDKQTGQLIADFSGENLKGPEIKTLETPDGDKINAVYDAQQKRWVPLDLGPAAPASTQSSPQIGAGAPAPAIGTPMPAPGGSQQPAIAPAPSGGTQQSAIPPAPPGMNKKDWRTTFTKETAEATAKGRAALPGVIRATSQILQDITDLEEHPSLARVTGPIDGRTPNYFGSSKDAEARITNLQGQTFLQAYETLKGAGAINVEEGKRAQEALNRLSTITVGDADYRRALADFKREVRGMLDTAKVKAGEMQQDHAIRRREAREAIKKGAPSDAVKQRLMQSGIDPEGL